mmetsp:Transcript_30774/g.96107  ORF Transcript_30774/g.96107 Transcript_30774/m.96107 type:complete len:209 (+) Transcript_30774:408-1034(+)
MAKRVASRSSSACQTARSCRGSSARGPRWPRSRLWLWGRSGRTPAVLGACTCASSRTRSCTPAMPSRRSFTARQSACRRSRRPRLTRSSSRPLPRRAPRGERGPGPWTRRRGPWRSRRCQSATSRCWRPAPSAPSKSSASSGPAMTPRRLRRSTTPARSFRPRPRPRGLHLGHPWQGSPRRRRRRRPGQRRRSAASARRRSASGGSRR